MAICSAFSGASRAISGDQHIPIIEINSQIEQLGWALFPDINVKLGLTKPT
jgi:hypothetical protein